jgi:biotin-(acetyl-CoA carboxylase) ligase
MPSRTSTAAAPSLDLPPPFRLVTLREVGDAFAHAQAIAAEEGAGTLVDVGRFDLSEFAVVLEPEEPLVDARQAFYACMVALRDALLVYAPPERPIRFGWPDAIHVDGGLIGGGRMAWPPKAAETGPPDWLVFGATVRTVSMAESDAGLRPLVTTLGEEGFGDASSGRLVESFARHLMVAMDAWRTNEFVTITRTYLDNLNLQKGAAASLDGKGDLLIRWRGQKEPDRHCLATALASPTWLDQATGGPRT